MIISGRTDDIRPTLIVEGRIWYILSGEPGSLAKFGFLQSNRRIPLQLREEADHGGIAEGPGLGFVIDQIADL